MHELSGWNRQWCACVVRFQRTIRVSAGTGIPPGVGVFAASFAAILLICRDLTDTRVMSALLKAIDLHDGNSTAAREAFVPVQA